MNELEAVWEELRAQRERQDALQAQQADTRVQITELTGQIKSVQADVRRLLILEQQAELSREVFRKEIREQLTEVAEARGAKNAIQYIVATVLAIAGLVLAYMGVKHG